MFLARSAFRLSCHLFLCRPSSSFSFRFWLHERFPSQRFIFFSTPRCAVGSDSDVTWNWWWKATPGAFLRVIRSKKPKKKEKTLRRINSLDWIVALHASYLIVTCNNNFVNAIITSKLLFASPFSAFAANQPFLAYRELPTKTKSYMVHEGGINQVCVGRNQAATIYIP